MPCSWTLANRSLKHVTGPDLLIRANSLLRVIVNKQRAATRSLTVQSVAWSRNSPTANRGTQDASYTIQKHNRHADRCTYDCQNP